MTDEMRAAWIEACAKAMFGDACRDSYAVEKATAAISVLTPLIEAETAERCAAIADGEKVNAEESGHRDDEVYNTACRDCAEAIRNAFPAKW